MQSHPIIRFKIKQNSKKRDNHQTCEILTDRARLYNSFVFGFDAVPAFVRHWRVLLSARDFEVFRLQNHDITNGFSRKLNGEIRSVVVVVVYARFLQFGKCRDN